MSSAESGAGPPNAADLISAQARLHPDDIALVDGSSTISFAELDRWTSVLADRFRQAGLGPGTLAGVFLDPSSSLVATLISLWKCGAAYVPLDPAYPRARLDYIATDSGLAAVVTRSGLLPLAPAGDHRVILLDGPDPAGGPLPRHTGFPDSDPVAYVLYTSGSTGRPNGVMVGHQNVLHLLDSLDDLLGDRRGVWLWVTSISFDISVLELFWTLSRGHTLVCRGAMPVAEAIAAHGINHLQCTPSLIRLLLAGSFGLRALASLDTLLVGGEALPLALARQLRAATSARIFNMYGPTETTVWSASWPLPSDGPGEVLIGRALSGESLCLLNNHGAPVDDGDVGEIYIGGAGVALGYLGRPELTASRFLPDPFHAGARFYRTGDLGRRRPAGSIEFLGRVDFQIKLSGHRVEIGEIETLLESHPAVSQAIVGMVDAGRDNARLLAWLVPANSDIPSPAGLRTFLAAHLPEAVIPSDFVFVKQMPLTPNGKVDRAGLRAPDAIPPQNDAPQTDLERAIATDLAAILGRPGVPSHVNFIDLGAHSLQIAELHSRIESRLSRHFPLVTLFRFSTVSALAAHLAAEAPSAGWKLDSTAALRARARRFAARREPGAAPAVTS